MRILGLDPGTHRLGYGVIDVSGATYTLVDYGCIQGGKNLSPGDRLLFIEQELVKILAEHKPDQVAVEELYFAKNVTTGLRVAEARGVILLVARRSELPVAEYKPTVIKVTVTGFGQAPKAQMQRMVQMTLHMKELPKPDDAADGLATAICHAAHRKMAEHQARSHS